MHDTTPPKHPPRHRHHKPGPVSERYLRGFSGSAVAAGAAGCPGCPEAVCPAGCPAVWWEGEGEASRAALLGLETHSTRTPSARFRIPAACPGVGG